MGEVLTPEQFSARYGQVPAQGAQQPQDDPTVGYSPGDAPDRLAPDTMKAFTLDLLANGGKGAASILTQDPGAQYRRNYATTQGTNAANLKYKQDMTTPLLDRIHDFANIGTKAGPDVLPLATGPNYGREDNANDHGFLHNLINDASDLYNGVTNGNLAMATGQDTASQAYQASRAARLGSGDPSKPNEYDKALSANIEMQHLRDAIGSAVKGLPGGKGGSTDQDQSLVLDMVGKALNAPNPEAFYKILHDAENTLRGRANLPALPEKDSYLPDEWQKKPPLGPPGSPPAPASSGFKYIGKVQ